MRFLKGDVDMRDRRVCFVVAVTLAASALSLGSVVVRGQAPAAAASVCPDNLPAVFHRCAVERMKAFTPPKTPDGKPDLQGYWNRTVVSFDVEWPEKPRTGDNAGASKTPGRRSLVVDPPDQNIPYQPWAAAQFKTNVEKLIDPQVGCAISPAPRASYISPVSQIIQTPGYVVILHEFNHNYRIVPTDGRPHVGPGIRLWGGDLRGSWDGNTLVVDTTNITSIAWIDSAGNFLSNQAHVVERFTPLDADTIHWEVTIDDPKVFTRPWKMAAAVRRNREKRFELMEESCQEGETDFEVFRKIRQPYTGVRPQ
jgi:hypothetical protein